MDLGSGLLVCELKVTNLKGATAPLEVWHQLVTIGQKLLHRLRWQIRHSSVLDRESLDRHE